MINQTALANIEIIDFEPEHATDFARLNYQWLDHFFYVEAIDRRILEHPVETIIHADGKIFMAKHSGNIVGTTALLPFDSNTRELAKMAVDPNYQGMKIGRNLLDHCIRTAIEGLIRRLVLFSNTRLTAAIRLYETSGFKEIPMQSTPYRRSNVFMELLL